MVFNFLSARNPSKVKFKCTYHDLCFTHAGAFAFGEILIENQIWKDKKNFILQTRVQQKKSVFKAYIDFSQAFDKILYSSI